MTHVAFAMDAYGYRWREDDGSESAASWISSQDATFIAKTGVSYRLRFLVQEIGGGTNSAYALRLKYEKNASGGFVNVTSTSSNIKAVTSVNYADGDDTTSQLTGGTGSFITDNNSMDDGGGVATCNVSASNHYEVEYCIQFVDGDISDGDRFELVVEDEAGTTDPTTSSDNRIVVLKDASTGVNIEEGIADVILTGTSHTLPEMAGGTDMLYVIFISASSQIDDITGVSGGSLTWTRRLAQDTGRGYGQGLIYTAHGSPTAFSPIVTWDGAPPTVQYATYRLSGADMTTPVEDPVGENTNGESGASTGGTDDTASQVTTGSTNANSVHFVAVNTRTASVSTPDVLYTRRTWGDGHSDIGGDRADLHVYSYLKAATGDEQFTNTLAVAVDWVAFGLVIIPASGSFQDVTTALSASGTLTEAVDRVQDVATVLEASGTLVDSVDLLWDVATALDMSATLTQSADKVWDVLTLLEASGSITETVDFIQDVLTSLLASGSLISGHELLQDVLTSLQATGSIAEVHEIVLDVLTTLASSATLTESGDYVQDVTTTLDASGSIASVVDFIVDVATTLEASGTITSATELLQDVVSSLSATATLTVTNDLVQEVLTTLSASATLAEDADKIQDVLTLLEGSSTITEDMTPVGGSFQDVVTSLTASVTLTAVNELLQDVVTSLAASVALTESADFVRDVTTALDGSATLVDTPDFLLDHTITLAGSASIAESGEQLQDVSTTLDMSTTLTGASDKVQDVVTNLEANATLSEIADFIKDGTILFQASLTLTLEPLGEVPAALFVVSTPRKDGSSQVDRGFVVVSTDELRVITLKRGTSVNSTKRG